MMKVRHRSCLLVTLALILTPCVIVLLVIGPELSTEQTLSQRLGECHMRLQYLESMYRSRHQDLAILSQYIGMMQQMPTNPTNSHTPSPSHTNATSINNSINITNVNSSHNSTSNSSSVLDALSAEAKQILYNSTQNARIMNILPQIRLPTVYNYLPHLLDDANSLRPALLKSRGRNDVNIVLGVPTVRRDKQSYLMGTLNNLIENMNDEEQNETLIVVFIGETDIETVHVIARDIESSFETYVENGLIDIIAPAPSYYPDLNKLRVTLNDPLERIKWRSKQNLDFAYLMTYGQTKGIFLENSRYYNKLTQMAIINSYRNILRTT